MIKLHRDRAGGLTTTPSQKVWHYHSLPPLKMKYFFLEFRRGDDITTS